MSHAFLAAALALLAAAQDMPAPPSPTSAAPAPACGAAEYRQFDFWLGDWDVYNAKGARAGRRPSTSRRPAPRTPALRRQARRRT